jgi:hypothetical protein
MTATHHSLPDDKQSFNFNVVENCAGGFWQSLLCKQSADLEQKMHPSCRKKSLRFGSLLRRFQIATL